ncbi:transcriptional activator of glycolytic enzymes-domain-containing protein [Phycomyces nitens]|nr:transcriptional activator of glycolytic enzymes-domain-containing protein [Phycomyces nitens]
MNNQIQQSPEIPIIENRSVNTSRSYASKQGEFKTWCQGRFADDSSYLVSGEKLLLFLSEAVVDRQSRRGRKAIGLDRKIKTSTMELYVAAITDLYQKQVRQGINSHSHPRIPAIKQLLRNMRREDQRKRRENLERYHSPTLSSQSFADTPQPDQNQVVQDDEPIQETNEMLRKVVPELKEEIRSLKNTLSLTINKMDALLSHFSAITSGAATLNLQMSWPSQTGFNSSSSSVTHAQTPLSAFNHQTQSHLEHRDTHRTAPLGTHKTTRHHPESDLDLSEPESALYACLDTRMPLEYTTDESLYRMRRDISTVTELWKEWTEGLDDGPSVAYLENKYGTFWPRTSSESKFFGKRKVIIDRIIDYSETHGISREMAAEIAEDRRHIKDQSLDWLSRNRESIF